MPNNVAIMVAEIRGTLSVIKAWGIGIAGIIGAIGLTSLGYAVAMNGQLGSMKVKLERIEQSQPENLQQELRDIQSKLDHLIGQKSPPTPEPSPKE